MRRDGFRHLLRKHSRQLLAAGSAPNSTDIYGRPAQLVGGLVELCRLEALLFRNWPFQLGGGEPADPTAGESAGPD